MTTWRGAPARALVVLVLVAAACSSTQLPDIEPSPPTEPPPDSSTTTTAPENPDIAPPPDATDPVDLPARLAALGTGGELLVRSSEGVWEQWSADGALVSQFNWSPDGEQLTWTEAASDGNRLVVGNGTDRTELSVSRPPFYLWFTPDGQEVSHLGSTPDQLFTLERSPITGPGTVLAEAAPLYYSYSGEGRLVTHEGTDELNLLTDGTTRSVATAAAGFRAPAWIDEEQVLGLVELPQADVLAIVGVEDRAVTPLFEVEGGISFVVSPDGTRVAYQIDQQAEVDDRPVGLPPAQTGQPGQPDVIVLDLETREATLAFIGEALWLDWSPDSTSLAALIGADDLTWRIWNEQELVRTDPLEISSVMAQQFVPFFDQYAQSLTGWSPDSTSYAFAASVGGRAGVFVQEADVGGDLANVGTGVMVAWSP